MKVTRIIALRPDGRITDIVEVQRGSKGTRRYWKKYFKSKGLTTKIEHTTRG